MTALLGSTTVPLIEAEAPATWARTGAGASTNEAPMSNRQAPFESSPMICLLDLSHLARTEPRRRTCNAWFFISSSVIPLVLIRSRTHMTFWSLAALIHRNVKTDLLQRLLPRSSSSGAAKKSHCLPRSVESLFAAPEHSIHVLPPERIGQKPVGEEFDQVAVIVLDCFKGAQKPAQRNLALARDMAIHSTAKRAPIADMHSPDPISIFLDVTVDGRLLPKMPDVEVDSEILEIDFINQLSCLIESRNHRVKAAVEGMQRFNHDLDSVLSPTLAEFAVFPGYRRQHFAPGQARKNP